MTIAYCPGLRRPHYLKTQCQNLLRQLFGGSHSVRAKVKTFKCNFSVMSIVDPKDVRVVIGVRTNESVEGMSGRWLRLLGGRSSRPAAGSYDSTPAHYVRLARRMKRQTGPAIPQLTPPFKAPFVVEVEVAELLVEVPDGMAPDPLSGT